MSIKQSKFKEILQTSLKEANDAISKSDVLKLFRIIIKQVKEMRQEAQNTIAEAQKAIVESQRTLSEAKKHTTEAQKQVSSTATQEAKKLRTSVAKIQSGAASEARKGIMPHVFTLNDELELLQKEIDELEGKIPDVPDLQPLLEKIREVEGKIPDVPDVQKMDDELKEEIMEEIKKLRSETRESFSNIPRGGGVSALGVRQAFKTIFHTEQPSGAIDGVNTQYTVENDIWSVIGFSLNGEEIAELPNYTFAGRTVTFDTALPAAYSGKDFEIKYIG